MTAEMHQQIISKILDCPCVVKSVRTHMRFDGPDYRSPEGIRQRRTTKELIIDAVKKLQPCNVAQIAAATGLSPANIHPVMLYMSQPGQIFLRTGKKSNSPSKVGYLYSVRVK